MQYSCELCPRRIHLGSVGSPLGTSAPCHDLAKLVAKLAHWCSSWGRASSAGRQAKYYIIVVALRDGVVRAASFCKFTPGENELLHYSPPCRPVGAVLHQLATSFLALEQSPTTRTLFRAPGLRRLTRPGSTWCELSLASLQHERWGGKIKSRATGSIIFNSEKGKTLQILSFLLWRRMDFSYYWKFIDFQELMKKACTNLRIF